jgi:hypothetical protein
LAAAILMQIHVVQGGACAASGGTDIAWHVSSAGSSLLGIGGGGDECGMLDFRL